MNQIQTIPNSILDSFNKLIKLKTNILQIARVTLLKIPSYLHRTLQCGNLRTGKISIFFKNHSNLKLERDNLDQTYTPNALF